MRLSRAIATKNLRKLLFYQFEFFTNFGKKDNILNFSEEVEAADAIIQNNGNKLQNMQRVPM